MARKNEISAAVLTVDMALDLLGGSLGRSSLYKYLRAGLIPHRRIGKKILIPRARLLEWLEGNDSRPQPGPAVGHDRS
jgi:excisionase family DNA binding protein